MNENQIIRTLKQQAWERAKGELDMLKTLSQSQSDDLDREIRDFINRVESNGWHE